jgi:hypothetical protein
MKNVVHYDYISSLRSAWRRRNLAKIPGNTAPDFRVGIVPVYGPLITGIHARSAFYAIFDLEMNLPIFIHSIAVCGTDVGGTFMGTGRVADIRINHNMWFDI